MPNRHSSGPERSALQASIVSGRFLSGLVRPSASNISSRRSTPGSGRNVPRSRPGGTSAAASQSSRSGLLGVQSRGAASGGGPVEALELVETSGLDQRDARRQPAQGLGYRRRGGEIVEFRAHA